MGLSDNLVSQFVKITNDNSKEKKETTLYGTVIVEGDKKYVTLDGADYTNVDKSINNNSKLPIDDKSTASISNGDRVTVLIKNHTAIITGNLKQPSASSDSVDNLRNTVNGFDDRIIAVEEVAAKTVTTEKLEAAKAEIKTAVMNEADIKYANIDRMETAEAEIVDLQADNVIIDGKVQANTAEIEKVKTDYVKTETANITYANIDFSNIGQAAIENLYSKSGLIENLTVSDGTITGRLVGVTIVGDMIEAGTLVADKLVVLGEDGLYYKLNTDGMTTEAEQTEYNSLNGSIITAKSITATKVSVDDLVAFDATIGGFNITDKAIYSEVKDSENNVTRGIYMDSDGQINFGDDSNFIKYYQDDDGTYKLAISAASILYALNGKQYSISDLGQIGDYVHIGTFEDEPCIELGEADSDFKLVITNTRILFMEGTETPAYINNQSLHITKAVIEEEIQQGDFVWKIRSNGNMGLVWKGGT